MTRIWHLLFGGKLMALAVDQGEVIREQRQIIVRQQEQIVQLNLEHTRAVRNLVEQFLVVQSEGTDVRDELLDGLRDLNDQVARLEEHAPS